MDNGDPVNAAVSYVSVIPVVDIACKIKQICKKLAQKGADVLGIGKKTTPDVAGTTAKSGAEEVAETAAEKATMKANPPSPTKKTGPGGGEGGGPGAGSGGGGGPGGAPKTNCHSFDPNTPVLMADGATKRIEDVQIGDNVLATNPRTGESESKPVTELHINLDRDLAEVTIKDTATATTTVLKTTANHPFWNASLEEWTEAANLKAGTYLRDDQGKETQQVVAVRTWTGLAEMRDLTVADIHTYYVIAAHTPVLVHNCPNVDFGFPSYRGAGGWVSTHGEAGTGMHWEHIVEQSQVGKSGFDPRMINHPVNIEAVPASINLAKNGYYGSITSFSNGMKVRDWLAGASWDQQYEFGLYVLRSIQAGLPLPR